MWRSIGSRGLILLVPVCGSLVVNWDHKPCYLVEIAVISRAALFSEHVNETLCVYCGAK